jgi:hypothetical protein
MRGLVPRIHVFLCDKDVDGGNVCANARKRRFALLPGHDERAAQALVSLSFRSP